MAILLGAPYTIVGPDGTIARINQPETAEFVGYLNEPPSGLDGAPIRERATSRTDGSGGAHGPFLQDRRPFSLSGFIYPSGDLADEQRQNRLLAATLALDADGELQWTEADRGDVRVPFRTQQPTKLTGRRPKQFTFSAVSADWRITSQVGHSPASGTGAVRDFQVDNNGNGPADWLFQLVTTGSAVVSFRLDLYSDAARTILISRTEVTLPFGLGATTIRLRSTGDLASGAGGDWGLYEATCIAGSTQDLTRYVVFDPLNYEPAVAGGTTYGRVTFLGATSYASMIDFFTIRHSWSQ